jgi:mono/diheme cytochrome c family protein
LTPSLIVAAEEAVPESPANANWGQLVLIFAAVVVLIWGVYLFIASRRNTVPAPEETPKNLQPYLSDDELENKRLTRILGAAVIASAFLAIALPAYYIGESRRQAEAAEAFEEKDIEEGEHWYEVFECIGCHAADGGGGGAEWVEARSGLSTTWSAPALNDVLYRYSEEEVEFWLNYGRSGTPMPVIGLVGGGAATIQEVDQLIAYIASLQLPQAEVLAKADGAVSLALNRLAGADLAVSELARTQQGVVDDIVDAPDQFDVVGTMPDDIRTLMASPEACTETSAAEVGATCNASNPDSDRDGLSDVLELAIAGPDNQFAAVAESNVLVRSVLPSDTLLALDVDGRAIYEYELAPSPDYPGVYGLSLSPLNAFTMTDAAGTPIPDLESLNTFLKDLDTAVLNLSVTSERNDRFLENAQNGLDFLIESFAAQLWTVDFDETAADMGRTAEEAERAVGLFNAYCARCHTGGYSAGVAYEQGAGSGAWGPALWEGRAVVQFPDTDDQVDFIIKGSNLGENYGVNGIGRGWMPGFGQVLTEDDIRLIVEYVRSM